MTLMILVVLSLLTLLCARMAQQMAAYQNRSVRFWIWAGAITGPLAPMALAILPRRITQ